MEMENRYASKGVAGTALGLGAGALGAQLLSGGLGGLFGNNCACNGESAPVNRYEAAQAARIAELETEVKLRDANTYTDQKLGALRDYVEGRVAHLEHEICDQKAYNAANTATIGCISGQVAQLMSLTKLIIPNGSICPGWGNITVTPETAAAGA